MTETNAPLHSKRPRRFGTLRRALDQINDRFYSGLAMGELCGLCLVCLVIALVAGRWLMALGITFTYFGALLLSIGYDYFSMWLDRLEDRKNGVDSN